MPPKPALQDVWMMIPSSNCLGLCEKSCTAIGMSRAERRMLEEVIPNFPSADKMMTDKNYDDDYRCPALVDGKCSAYDVRPTVCRIFGSAESLPCPWGCTPDGGLMSREETSQLFAIAMEIGGGPG